MLPPHGRAISASERDDNRSLAITVAQAVESGDVWGAWLALQELADPGRGGELLDLAEWLAMLAGGLAASIVDAGGLSRGEVWAQIRDDLPGMPEVILAFGGGSLWRPGESHGKSRPLRRAAKRPGQAFTRRHRKSGQQRPGRCRPGRWRPGRGLRRSRRTLRGSRPGFSHSHRALPLSGPTRRGRS